MRGLSTHLGGLPARAGPPGNLANEARHRDLVLARNAKWSALIDAEVGEDDGQMLPGGADAGWEVTWDTRAP